MGLTTKMDVIYDTGSDWLMIEGSDCLSCEGSVYDISPALSTGQAVQLSQNRSKRTYGDLIVSGREFTDKVCVLFSACVNDFEFFYVDTQNGGFKEPVDGILGMARNK